MKTYKFLAITLVLFFTTQAQEQICEGWKQLPTSTPNTYIHACKKDKACYWLELKKIEYEKKLTDQRPTTMAGLYLVYTVPKIMTDNGKENYQILPEQDVTPLLGVCDHPNNRLNGEIKIPSSPNTLPTE